MYTLRLLGTASIDASQHPVTGRAAQGRRLALLAVLALARGRAVSRDKLIGLLWPEISPERARPQLSDTLYIIRNGLGDDVVRSAGDAISLDPSAITSDVEQFEQSLDEGRREEAVQLYTGPLLDGFHIPESVEFESWLDAERTRVARRYADALEALAAAAEADADADAPARAVRWWRQLAALDACNGRVALRLMLALEAAGDRAGALQHARIHATLLRGEFDAEPDAEITALVERLRREPPATPAAKTATAIVTSHETPLVLQSEQPSDRPSALPSALPSERAPSSPVPPPQPTQRRVPRRTIVAAAVLIVVAAAVGLAYALTRDTGPAPPRSVGVLPFVNMSADPANTYFSDGLSEQIILALSRIPELRVAARTSSFALRDGDLSARAIGDALDVQAVLEGSVLVDGDRLRIIAQLIDARTGYHIWSEQYDTEVRDVFEVQERIAGAITRALHLQLAGPASGARASSRLSLEAYDLYLRGLYLRNGLSADGLRQASAYFDRVIRMEPGYAPAWAAKASVTAPQAFYRYAPRDSVVAVLRVLTSRALELDSTVSEAHVEMGALKLFYDWDWEAAGRELLRATELNPNDALGWHQLASYYNVMGSPAEAIAAREMAVRLDPLNPRSRAILAKEYLYARNYDLALEHAQRAARLDPVHPVLLGMGSALPIGAAEVFLQQGREAEAVQEYLRVAALRGATAKELDDMRSAWEAAGIRGFWKSWLGMDLRQSGASPDPVRMASTHMMMGDTTGALDWLDRAFDERAPALIYLRRDPAFAGLLGHPRVGRILREMKFPD